MKKVIIMFIISTLLVSCGINKVNNNSSIQNETIEEESSKEEEEIVFTEFKALNNVYKTNEDIKILSIGEEVFNSRNDNPYVVGKYKEVDFANDLITQYLSGNQEIYYSLVSESLSDDKALVKINEEEKVRLQESLDFLKVQMEVEGDNPIYFRINDVTYEGQANGLENSVQLGIKGHISAVDGYFVSLTSFTVMVYEVEDKLFATII